MKEMKNKINELELIYDVQKSLNDILQLKNTYLNLTLKQNQNLAEYNSITLDCLTSILKFQLNFVNKGNYIFIRRCSFIVSKNSETVS